MSELYDMGARVVSVGGPFNARTLVEMPTTLAEQLFDGLGASCADDVVSAVRGDLAKLPTHLAESGLAAVAVTLARQVQDPFNSATSVSMCAARLAENLAELHRMAPPERKADKIDDIAERREKRRAAAAAGGAAS